MSQPFVGEIRMFAGNFAPLGWAFCDGRLLAIADNDTLFNLIGTTYGGDGVQTFGLPDLRGRVPIHVGSGFALAQNGGVEQVTLTSQQMPTHSHAAQCRSGSSDTPNPAAAVWGASSSAAYANTGVGFTGAPMAPTALGLVGSNQPHENMMPFVAVNFIIALNGLFPTQS